MNGLSLDYIGVNGPSYVFAFLIDKQDPEGCDEFILDQILPTNELYLYFVINIEKN